MNNLTITVEYLANTTKYIDADTGEVLGEVYKKEPSNRDWWIYHTKDGISWMAKTENEAHYQIRQELWEMARKMNKGIIFHRF